MSNPKKDANKGAGAVAEAGLGCHVYRIYAPVNNFSLVGTIEFGVFSDVETARDRLLRLSAEMADTGFGITWIGDDGDGFRACRNGYVVRVMIDRFLLDEFVTMDRTERVVKTFSTLEGTA